MAAGRATTIKLSVQTRERLRAFGGETYEETIVEALDALDAQRFWTHAEAAAAWRSAGSPADAARRSVRDRAVAELVDGAD